MIGHPSYKLDSLCRYFGIKLNNHHHALDDAKACAQLLLKLSEKYELSDVETIYVKTNIQAGEISEAGYRSSLVKKAISYK
jgi:DNA polymerase-3 subunit epsilon